MGFFRRNSKPNAKPQATAAAGASGAAEIVTGRLADTASAAPAAPTTTPQVPKKKPPPNVAKQQRMQPPKLKPVTPRKKKVIIGGGDGRRPAQLSPYKPTTDYDAFLPHLTADERAAQQQQLEAIWAAETLFRAGKQNHPMPMPPKTVTIATSITVHGRGRSDQLYREGKVWHARRAQREHLGRAVRSAKDNLGEMQLSVMGTPAPPEWLGEDEGTTTPVAPAAPPAAAPAAVAAAADGKEEADGKNPPPPQQQQKKRFDSLFRKGRRIFTPQSKNWRKREIRKWRAQKQECSFAPNLGHSTVDAGVNESEMASDCLYRQGEARWKRIRKREQENPTGCTFAPRLETSKFNESLSGRTPIWKRPLKKKKKEEEIKKKKKKKKEKKKRE